MGAKWLYRLESTDNTDGLYYNVSGEYVIGLSKINNGKIMPMEYDERYQQRGKNWFSSCSTIEDLLHWYTLQNAKELVARGYRFSKYLAVDYVEYEKETVFLKETCLDRVTLQLEELFNSKT